MQFRSFLIFILCLYVPVINSFFADKPFTIMIDPAGDAKNLGRSLPNDFESNSALKFAKALRQSMLELDPQVEVILTRSGAETLEPLQSASFANRLSVDLFVSLHFYKETNVKPNIFIFYFKNRDFFTKISQPQLCFYPYHQAFTMNFGLTNNYAHLLQAWLTQPQYKHYFECKKAVALPFKPLIGITAPAIGIEIGIKSNGYDPYLMPIANGLLEIAHAQA